MDNIKNGDNKILNVRPLCIIAVCFLTGIYCSNAVVNQNYLLAFSPLVIFCLAVAILCIINRKQKSIMFVFLLCCILVFALGALNFDLRVLSAKNAKIQYETGTFSGRVASVKEYDDNLFRIIFDKCEINGVKLSGKSVSYIYGYSFDNQIQVGGVYSFRASIKNRYLAGERDSDIFSGVYYKVNTFSKAEYLRDEKSVFQSVYTHIKQTLKSGIQKGNYAISLALITGDTSEISYSSLQNYRMAGIAHVFAVSGLHVGTLAMVLSFIFKRLKMKRWQIFFATVIPVTIYCGICGFSSSSVRALIMSGLILLSNCIGFKRDTLSAIAVAAIILTAINPTSLFEAGFQLSFIAVTSIVILSPVFLRGANNNKTFGEPLATSLSASLGTLPIISDISGYISVISLLTNLIFVPIVMIIFQILLACLVFGAIEYAIFNTAIVSLFISDNLIYAIDFIVNIFSFEKVVIPVEFGNVAIIYYIGLVIISDVVNLTFKQKAILGVLSAIFTVVLICI